MSDIDAGVARFRASFDRARAEVGRVIVGNSDIVEGVLIALIAGGHVLLEGVPGLGKTLLVRTLAQALDLSFSRVQFTPDLMPADISGTMILVEEDAAIPGGVPRRAFQFQPGPIFAHIVLADEINRATPKTQSAMLEAMQEHSVTVAGESHTLVEPFFVLATQNPIEMEGTYPLPEAQLDRFLFKLMVPSPTLAELSAIMDRTTGTASVSINKILSADDILPMRALARDVPIAAHLRDYVAALIVSTHPTSANASDMARQFVRAGSSPRGAQAIVLAAKIRAILAGRYNVAAEDINTVAVPALRHRILLNFEGEAEGIKTEDIIAKSIENLAASDKMALRV